MSAAAFSEYRAVGCVGPARERSGAEGFLGWIEKAFEEIVVDV